MSIEFRIDHGGVMDHLFNALGVPVKMKILVRGGLEAGKSIKPLSPDLGISIKMNIPVRVSRRA